MDDNDVNPAPNIWIKICNYYTTDAVDFPLLDTQPAAQIVFSQYAYCFVENFHAEDDWMQIHGIKLTGYVAFHLSQKRLDLFLQRAEKNIVISRGDADSLVKATLEEIFPVCQHLPRQISIVY